MGEMLKIWANRSEEDPEGQIYLDLIPRFDGRAIILTAVDYDGDALERGSILGINNEAGTIVGCSKIAPRVGLKTNDEGEPIVE